MKSGELKEVEKTLDEDASILVGQVFIQVYELIDRVHSNAGTLFQGFAIKQMSNEDG